MQYGPFTIALYAPGAWGPCAWSLNIWPGGKIVGNHRVHQHKVVNVFWDQLDNIDIWTFRSGPWEGELLTFCAARATYDRLVERRLSRRADARPFTATAKVNIRNAECSIAEA